MLNSRRPCVTVRAIAQTGDIAGIDERLRNAVLTQRLGGQIGGEPLSDTIQRHGGDRPTQSNPRRAHFDSAPINARLRRVQFAERRVQRSIGLLARHTGHGDRHWSAKRPSLPGNFVRQTGALPRPRRERTPSRRGGDPAPKAIRSSHRRVKNVVEFSSFPS